MVVKCVVAKVIVSLRVGCIIEERRDYTRRRKRLLSLGLSRSRSRDRRRTQRSESSESQEKVDPIAMNFNNFDRSSKKSEECSHWYNDQLVACLSVPIRFWCPPAYPVLHYWSAQVILVH